MHQGEYIKKVLKERKITQDKLAKDLDISRGHLINKLKEIIISDDKIDTRNKILNYLNLKPEDLPRPTEKEVADFILRESNVIYMGEAKKLPKGAENGFRIGSMEIPEGEEDSPFIDLHNGQYIMVVPLIEERAHAGYIDHISDKVWIEEQPKHTFTVNRHHRGKYYAFTVVGDSMEDGTVDSIPEGSIVTGRDISKHLWRSKFHIHRFKEYIIVHNDGIIVKQITNHDVENGIITCHSLNSKYEDFDIHLDDCKQILNVVNVTHIR